MSIVSLPEGTPLDVERVCILCDKPLSLDEASVGMDDRVYHSSHTDNMRDFVSSWANYRIAKHFDELYDNNSGDFFDA